MEFLRFRMLIGPNAWAYHAIVETLVDLGDRRDISSEMMPGFNDRLKNWLPTLIEHRCSPGVRGGFYQRLERGTYLAHILEHVAIELLTLAGIPTGYGRARETDTDGIYRVAIECTDLALGQATFETGRALCLAAVEDRPFDVNRSIDRLRGEVANAQARNALLHRPAYRSDQSIVAIGGHQARTLAVQRTARLLGCSQPTENTLVCLRNECLTAGERIDIGSEPVSAICQLLAKPRITLALFDTPYEMIAHCGLPFRRCRVGVLTDIGPAGSQDLEPFDNFDWLERYQRTLMDVVDEQGVGILNADDPATAAMTQYCQAAILFFSRNPGSPTIAEHLARGRRAVLLDVSAGSAVGTLKDHAVLKEGQTTLAEFALPTNIDRSTQHAESLEEIALLAAIATAWSLGIPFDLIAARLAE